MRHVASLGAAGLAPDRQVRRAGDGMRDEARVTPRRWGGQPNATAPAGVEGAPALAAREAAPRPQAPGSELTEIRR